LLLKIYIVDIQAKPMLKTATIILKPHESLVNSNKRGSFESQNITTKSFARAFVFL